MRVQSFRWVGRAVAVLLALLVLAASLHPLGAKAEPQKHDPLAARRRTMLSDHFLLAPPNDKVPAGLTVAQASEIRKTLDVGKARLLEVQRKDGIFDVYLGPSDAFGSQALALWVLLELGHPPKDKAIDQGIKALIWLGENRVQPRNNDQGGGGDGKLEPGIVGLQTSCLSMALCSLHTLAEARELEATGKRPGGEAKEVPRKGRVKKGPSAAAKALNKRLSREEQKLAQDAFSALVSRQGKTGFWPDLPGRSSGMWGSADDTFYAVLGLLAGFRLALEGCDDAALAKAIEYWKASLVESSVPELRVEFLASIEQAAKEKGRTSAVRTKPSGWRNSGVRTPGQQTRPMIGETACGASCLLTLRHLLLNLGDASRNNGATKDADAALISGLAWLSLTFTAAEERFNNSELPPEVKESADFWLLNYAEPGSKLSNKVLTGFALQQLCSFTGTQFIGSCDWYSRITAAALNRTSRLHIDRAGQGKMALGPDCCLLLLILKDSLDKSVVLEAPEVRDAVQEDKSNE